MMLEGIRTLAPTGVMLMFAILYFGIMIDAGLFDPLNLPCAIRGSSALHAEAGGADCPADDGHGAPVRRVSSLGPRQPRQDTNNKTTIGYRATFRRGI
jgi:hypothetical protein